MKNEDKTSNLDKKIKMLDGLYILLNGNYRLVESVKLFVSLTKWKFKSVWQCYWKKNEKSLLVKPIILKITNPSKF